MVQHFKINQSIYRFFLAILFMAGFSNSALALSCLSDDSDDWSAISSWTNCGGGIPGPADDVTILVAHTISLNVDANINSLTIVGILRVVDPATPRTLDIINGVTATDTTGNTGRLQLFGGPLSINTGGDIDFTNGPIKAAGGADVPLTLNAGNNDININSIDNRFQNVPGYLALTGANAIVNAGFEFGNVLHIRFGTINLTGDLTLNNVRTAQFDGPTTAGIRTLNTDSNAVFNDIVNANLNGTGAGQFDQTIVVGVVEIAGSLNITVGSGMAGTPVGTEIVLLDNDAADAINGTFAGLAEGATLTVGTVDFTVSYIGGDGNDFTLTNQAAIASSVAAPIPTLSEWMLILLSLMLGLFAYFKIKEQREM